MNPHRSQVQYWNELTGIKADIEFLHLYLIESSRIDSFVKILLALASSGGIAGWAIWEDPKMQFFWASLIALSQVVNAISKYLPWEKRVKAIQGAKFGLLEVLSLAERDWYSVSGGSVSAEEIHKLVMNIKDRRNEVTNKYMREIHLPHNKRYMKMAADRADDYFDRYYSVKQLPYESD